jgi:hypothetical protein
VGSLASTFGLEWWKGRGATRQLAIAISAEVEATARMLRFRDAVEGLRQAMEAARAGSTDVWSFEVGDDYLPISRSAMGTIGAFKGDVPYLLAELLTLTRSAKIDLDEMRDPEGTLAGKDSQTIFSHYWQLVAILEHATGIADRLVAEIAKQYRVPTRRPWDPEKAPGAAPNQETEARDD